MDQSTLNLVFTFVTMVAVVVGAFMVCWQYRNRHGIPAILIESASSGIQPGAAFRISLEGRSQWRITRIRPARRTARFFDLFSQGAELVDPNEGFWVHEQIGFAVVAVAPKKNRNRGIAHLLIETRVHGLERPVRVRRRTVNVTTGYAE